MPRYFFHSADGRRHVDEEGTVLPDLAAAREAAVRFSGHVLADNPEPIWERGHWRVEVTGEDGRLLFNVITVAVDAPPLRSLKPGAPAND